MLKAGNWCAANNSRRTPVASLGLRVARAFGEPVWGVNATVAKIIGAVNRVSGQSYGSTSLEHEYLLQIIRNQEVSWFESFKIEEGRRVDRMRPISQDYMSISGFARRLLLFTSSKWSATLFNFTGVDLVELALSLVGVEKGEILSSALISRTGERQQNNLSVKKVLRMIRDES